MCLDKLLGGSLDGSDLLLDLFHLLLGQGVELHGDDVADQADDDHTEGQESDGVLQLGDVVLGHGGVAIGEADGGEHDGGDHGSEGGDDLIDEGEQGTHQTGQVLAGTVNLVVGAVSGHGDNDVAGDALEASLQDGHAQVSQQEHGTEVQSALGSIGGDSGGIAEDPQASQQSVHDDAAPGADQHSLALAQLGSDGGDGQEGDDAAGNGGQSGDGTLGSLGAGQNSEHSDGDGRGLSLGSQLVGGSGDNQHLDGAVVLQNLPVVLQADLLSSAGAEELGAVLGSDGEDSDGGEQAGHADGEQPNPMEELSSTVAAHAGGVDVLELDGGVGVEDADQSEQNGVVNGIEGSEQGALLGVVGQTGLGRLGDDTLAGVANIVRSRHDDEENQADVALGQHVGHMEQDERSDAQKPPD